MKKALSLLFILFAFAMANAQSLPKVQQGGIKLPANVKIDGKTDEWNNKFMAYNPATELFYTIANDDKRLYLIIQANDPNLEGTVNRILASGITLTLFNKNQKNNKGITITYPATDVIGTALYSFKGADGKLIKITDSLVQARNLDLQKKFKFIKLSGIKNLTTIPVYNDEGIEAAHRFDIKNNYTLELSIPLAVAGSQVNAANALAYKITVNGSKAAMFEMQKAESAGTSSNPQNTSKVPESIMKQLYQMNATYTGQTNFSGEYTLVK
ncbi:MAG: hypothetical protein EOP47_07305 [Sphingobacteriaceae bacterium]|nr:MAG: hypothetical protein EOP47_07305 [Sphingobacteriaceae bacterium]